MSHEIEEGQVATRDTLGWHKLGTVITGKTTVTEAFVQAKLIYKVHKVPVAIDFPGLEDPRQFALVREATADGPPKFFGFATEQYQLAHNEEIAAALDPLGEVWPVETAGAIHGGREVFCTLKAGDIEVAGDELWTYFLVHEAKDGRGGLSIQFVPFRVVCKNTLMMALSRAQLRIPIGHNAQSGRDLEFWVRHIEGVRAAEAGGTRTLQQMAASPLAEQQVRDILAETYNDPPLKGSDTKELQAIFCERRRVKERAFRAIAKAAALD
jgi:hypothetical protein